MLDIDYEVLENRLRNGLAAGAGTFAMVSVTAFRIGHEKGLALLPSKVFKFAAAAGALSAIAWALMPKASEKPSSAIEEAKEQIYPAFKVGLNRILQNEATLQGIVRDQRQEREEDSNLSRSLHDGPSRQRSIDRVNRRYGNISSYGSGFESNDFDYRSRRDEPDTEDFLSESEFLEALRDEAESDPFYEGPASPFDKV